MAGSKKGGFTRRHFIQGTAAVAASSAIPGGTVGAAKPTELPPGHVDADVIFTNGKIHTMDAKNTIASAVAIKDGRFLEVGSHVQRGPRTKVVDLQGRMVVPGIIDNHNHIVLMGNRPGYHTPLENAYSIAEVQQLYASRAASAPRDAWITTIGGFHSNHFAPERRLPNLNELNAAVPNNPVYLHIGFNGPATTNSLGKAALEAQGISVGADGSMSGTNPPRALLYLRQALLNSAERRRSVMDAMNYAVSVGVTTHLDQGAFQKSNTPSDGAAHEDNYTMHIPFLETYAEGKALFRLRINFLHMETDQNTPELVQRLKNAFPFFGDDMVRTGGIGEFIAAGTNAASPFVAAATRVAKAGWRAEVHSLSQTDYQQEIQGFEAAHAVAPITNLRWVVAHAPFITQEYVNRLKALGGGISLFGGSRYLTGSTVNNGPPYRMIIDSGINAGMSCDGMQVAPLNPWISMYYASTGINALGLVINGAQKISRQEVLSLYTRQNGWFLREEDQLGSIAPGKLADLVVLNRDYFAASDEDLKKIRSVLTVVGGNVVHDSGVVSVDR
jgi:predicted amidohydrolase YtcJ